MVITAGACTDPASPKIHEVVAGTLYRSEVYPGQQVRLPAVIVPHPDYVWPPYDDLSLIFLDKPFVFHENISAISLPEAFASTYPNPVVVNGWGAEQYGLPMSDVLKRVTLDTYTDEHCESFMNETIPVELICAGTDEGDSSSCIGDAGAPLTTTTDKVYLVGVVSHFGCSGDCCGEPGPMEHCLEISHYLDWILEQSKIYGGGL